MSWILIPCPEATILTFFYSPALLLSPLCSSWIFYFHLPNKSSIGLNFHQPDTSTTGHRFHFGSASSFFLELFLCSSPVACWTPTNLAGSPFNVIPFCLFILFMGCSRQECWSGLPFLSAVDHILSELSTMTHPSWVAPYDMAHSSLSYTKLWFMWSFWLVFCDCGFHSVCPLMDADKRPVQASWWEGPAVGKTGFCFGGQGHAQ